MPKAYALALVLCGMAAGVALADDGVEQVEQVLRAYEQAWSRHDARAVASFYHEPAMRVTPAGPVVRSTRADQEAFFTGFLASLVARGYERSTWEELNVHLLDESTAVASGVMVRHGANGEVFARRGDIHPVEGRRRMENFPICHARL